MLIRGRTPIPGGVSLFASLGLLVAMGCGEQDPSFQEARTYRGEAERIGLDATAEEGQEELPEGYEDLIDDKDPNSTDDYLANRNGSVTGSDDGSDDGTGGSGDSGSSTDPDGEGDWDGSGEPPIGFELTSETHNIDSGSKKVDILWVVDSSASMGEEQVYLGDNFDAFITSLASNQNTDFQTAITTADACNDSLPADLSEVRCPIENYGNSNYHPRGDFIGDAGNTVLHRDEANIIADFNRYANVGIDGNGFEHGLKSAELAVAKALAGQNEPLLRSDSFLSVIIVSDEEDDGIGLGMMDGHNDENFFDLGLTTFRYTHSDFIGYLSTTLGAGKYAVSTITGTRNPDGSMCSSPHSSPKEEGTQYIAAASETGGIVQSICETDWDESLSEIGVDIQAQASQVILTNRPVPATIKVFVNGVESTNWDYVPASQSIKFHSGNLPANGTGIRVEYYYHAG